MSVTLSQVTSLLESQGPSSLETLAHILDEQESTLRALLTGAYRRGHFGFDSGLYFVLSEAEKAAVKLTMSPPAAPAPKPEPAPATKAAAKPAVTSAQMRDLLRKRGEMTAAELAKELGIKSGMIGPAFSHDRKAGRVVIVTLDKVNYYKLAEPRDTAPPAAPAAPEDKPALPPIADARLYPGSALKEAPAGSVPAVANTQTLTIPTVDFITSEIHRLVGELRQAKELRAAIINLNRLTNGEFAIWPTCNARVVEK